MYSQIGRGCIFIQNWCAGAQRPQPYNHTIVRARHPWRPVSGSAPKAPHRFFFARAMMPISFNRAPTNAKRDAKTRRTRQNQHYVSQWVQGDALTARRGNRRNYRKANCIAARKSQTILASGGRPETTAEFSIFGSSAAERLLIRPAGPLPGDFAAAWGEAANSIMLGLFGSSRVSGADGRYFASSGMWGIWRPNAESRRYRRGGPARQSRGRGRGSGPTSPLSAVKQRNRRPRRRNAGGRRIAHPESGGR